MGGAILSESLIQFSFDGHGCVPSLFSELKPNYGGGNEDNGNLLQKAPCTAALSDPTLQQATANPRLCWRLVDAHGQVWISLLWVTAPFSWVLVHRDFACPLQEPISPVLYKFWQLYGGVNVQEGLCHTQVYCTQRLCPCSSPLLAHTSTGDTQTQVCLSLCRVCLSPLSISGGYRA